MKLLIYKPYEKYSYESFKKSQIKKGLSGLYELINLYGENNDFESYLANSDKVFSTIMDYYASDRWNKTVVVKINISVILRSDHTKSLLKDSASYHKTVKGFKLSYKHTMSILYNGIRLERTMNIQYLQIKLGKIRVRLRY